MKFAQPNIMISACLEHSSVRYDGTMISDETVRKLKEFVNFIPVCPEVAIGMPAPRDAVRLVQRKGETLKLLSSIKGDDYTEKMEEFTQKYVQKLQGQTIDGFILKAKSPTCGTDKIKVYSGTGKAQSNHSVQNGLFAQEIVDKYPEYPIESERRLSNFTIRENFYIQIFTKAQFRQIYLHPIKELVAFHSNNKYLFMAYNQSTLRKMGNIVANHDHLGLKEVYDAYKEQLSKLLFQSPSKQKKINTLTHIYGYFKNDLTPEEKEYYFETQNDYLSGHVPYSTPLSILKGFAIRFQNPYLMKQSIFEPYPKQLISQLDSGKKL